MKDLFKAYADILKSPVLSGRSYVIANFVSTLDGVVSYNIPRKSSGGEISGFNAQDRYLMALLRTQADAVLVGAGTLRDDPLHVRTPEFVFPEDKPHFQSLRNSIDKPSEYLNVFVTKSGDIDLKNPSFSTPGLKTLVITTTKGESSLREYWADRLRLTQIRTTDDVTPTTILKTLFEEFGVKLLLLEGGPRLFGQFLKENLVDEIFLTLAPQIAGRSRDSNRISLVEGFAFTPETAPWFELTTIRRANNHLFLRYQKK